MGRKREDDRSVREIFLTNFCILFPIHFEFILKHFSHGVSGHSPIGIVRFGEKFGIFLGVDFFKPISLFPFPYFKVLVSFFSFYQSSNLRPRVLSILFDVSSYRSLFFLRRIFFVVTETIQNFTDPFIRFFMGLE